MNTAASEGIMKLLQNLNDDGHTCIIVTHNPENINPKDVKVSYSDHKH